MSLLKTLVKAEPINMVLSSFFDFGSTCRKASPQFPLPSSPRQYQNPLCPPTRSEGTDLTAVRLCNSVHSLAGSNCTWHSSYCPYLLFLLSFFLDLLQVGHCSSFLSPRCCQFSRLLSGAHTLMLQWRKCNSGNMCNSVVCHRHPGIIPFQAEIKGDHNDQTSGVQIAQLGCHRCIKCPYECVHMMAPECIPQLLKSHCSFPSPLPHGLKAPDLLNITTLPGKSASSLPLQSG